MAIRGGWMRGLLAAGAGVGALLLAGACSAQTAAAIPNAPPAAYASLGRDMLKGLVEIDSTHAHGSTGAARYLAARFLAAGFPAADVQVLAPPDHPTKGNLVVRLHGTGAGAPVMFLGHLDVVEAHRADWTYDPFAFTLVDGYAYGRGTEDMKSGDAAMAAALIRLRESGFKPSRDIIVAFTADEEAGGDASGIDWLLKTHRPLIDAGLVINPDGGEAALKDGRQLYLAIQTSEKVFATFRLEAHDKGGHSSRPTPANPIYHMAAALDRLSHYSSPVDLTPTTEAYFNARAGLETGQVRADMLEAATGHPSAAAVTRLSSQLDTNIALRTTCTATVINGGQGESALPEDVTALVQCRVMPNKPIADVEARLKSVIDDPAIAMSTYTAPKLSPESPLSPQVTQTVSAVAHSIWPGLIILPELSAGATDSAFTRAAGIPSYGVDGDFLSLDDSRAHGRDERVNLAAFDQDLEFTYRLMKALGSAN